MLYAPSDRRLDAAYYIVAQSVIFEQPKFRSKVSLLKLSPSLSEVFLITRDIIWIVNEVFLDRL